MYYRQAANYPFYFIDSFLHVHSHGIWLTTDLKLMYSVQGVYSSRVKNQQEGLSSLSTSTLTNNATHVYLLRVYYSSSHQPTERQYDRRSKKILLFYWVKNVIIMQHCLPVVDPVQSVGWIELWATQNTIFLSEVPKSWEGVNGMDNDNAAMFVWWRRRKSCWDLGLTCLTSGVCAFFYSVA